MKDYYYILGIKRNSTSEEIRSAYLKLSKKLHPDLNNGEIYFEEMFKQIQEAYETISDINKRQRYDELLNKNYSLKYDGNNFNKSEPKKDTDFVYKQDNNKNRDQYTDIKNNIRDKLIEVKKILSIFKDKTIQVRFNPNDAEITNLAFQIISLLKTCEISANYDLISGDEIFNGIRVYVDESNPIFGNEILKQFKFMGFNPIKLLDKTTRIWIGTREQTK